jgi:hypothetical protein
MNFCELLILYDKISIIALHLNDYYTDVVFYVYDAI